MVNNEITLPLSLSFIILYWIIVITDPHLYMVMLITLVICRHIEILTYTIM